MVEFSPNIRRYENRWRKWKNEDPNLVRLRNVLLDIGGEEVVPIYEPDTSKLLNRGHVIDKKDIEMNNMRDSQCHSNVGYLYEKNDSIKIATGWALSDDGLWRQHSWGLTKSDIIETTEKRDIYYGMVLDNDESREFVARNR